jgi:putative flippase GtrA
MRDRVARLLEWSHTHQGKKLIRFTSVSVISTLTSQAFIFIFFQLAGIGVVESTVLANVIATVPSYNLNRRWSWGKSGRSHLFKEVVPFWVISGLGITTSFFGSLVAKSIVNAHKYPHVTHALAWPRIIDWVIVAVANFGSFAIFWVLKLLLFNRIFHVPSELDEIEEHLGHEEELEAHLEDTRGLTARQGEPLSP